MIEVIEKDITTVTTGVVAHGVNCQHAMGSGVALAIKKKWPLVYRHYMAAPYGKNMLGAAWHVNINPMFDDLFIINCYTQECYGYGAKRYADLGAIEQSLTKVYEHAEHYDLNVYLPKIGAGLGGLDWATEVLPIIERIDTAYNPNNTTYICEWE